MFVPPPASNLSAADARARLEVAKGRQNADSDASSMASPANSIRTGSPLPLSESRDSKKSKARSKRFFRRKDKSDDREIRVSSPIVSSPESPLPPLPEPERFQDDADLMRSKPPPGNRFNTNPFEEAERRRAIRGPPKRPARPIGAPLPPIPGAYSAPPQPLPSQSPPPVPEKVSPTRDGFWSGSRPLPPMKHEPIFSETALSHALGHLMFMEPASLESYVTRELPPVRASTAPPTAGRKSGTAPPFALPRRVSSARTPASQENKAVEDENSASQSGESSTDFGKRIDSGVSRPATLEPFREFDNARQLRTDQEATDSDHSATRHSSVMSAESQWKRLGQGKTTGNPLDVGFAVQISGRTNIGHDSHSHKTSAGKLPALLEVLDKDLPNTPDSILDTPTEMYLAPSSSSGQELKQLSVSTELRDQISDMLPARRGTRTPPRAHFEQILPDRLSAIPEAGSMFEKSPPPSGLNTPRAMSIRLREGSVLTIRPPEVTAWQRSLYLHGPIKLLKPAILPAKNSVASLDPFQDVVEQMYYHKPRRRSDDTVIDDICDWIAAFAFAAVSFDGDKLAVEAGDDSDSNTEPGQESETWHTPPMQAERESAGEVLEPANTAEVLKPLPLPLPPIPPVSTEEGLRTRGIARLAAGHQRNASHKRDDSFTITLPAVADDWMTIEKLSPQTNVGDLVGKQGFDWDDGSGSATVSEKGTREEARNPVTTMRRLMASAKTML